MASKKKSYKGKKQYGVYQTQNRAEKNRIAKLKRHAKKHPNDVQGTAALKHTGTRRSKPNVKGNFKKPSRSFRTASGHLIVMPQFGRQ